MATIDRVEPSYAPWTPSAAGFGSTATDKVVDDYVGKHRLPGVRRLRLMQLLYRGKHRRH